MMSISSLKRKRMRLEGMAQRARCSEFDAFWDSLAKNLMLDELLAGEGDPVEWLKEMVELTSKEAQADLLESEANRIRSTPNEQR